MKVSDLIPLIHLIFLSLLCEEVSVKFLLMIDSASIDCILMSFLESLKLKIYKTVHFFVRHV